MTQHVGPCAPGCYRCELRRDEALDALRDDLDAARQQADGYVDLVHAAVSHHLTAHPDCEGYQR